MGLRFKSLKYFACVILRPRCEAIVKRHAWLVDWTASYCQDTWQLLIFPSAKFRACSTFHVDKSCRNTLLPACPRSNLVLSRLVISNKNRRAMRLIRTLEHSLFRQILCFFTLISNAVTWQSFHSLNIQLHSQWEIQRFSGIFLWLFSPWGRKRHEHIGLLHLTIVVGF